MEGRSILVSGLAPLQHSANGSDLTSSNSALHVSVYDRSREGEGFLGMLDIKPVLKDGYTLDSWYKLSTRGQEHVTGEIWIQATYTALRVCSSAEMEITANVRTKLISSPPISSS